MPNNRQSVSHEHKGHFVAALNAGICSLWLDLKAGYLALAGG
jgi:hypothetical protein